MVRGKERTLDVGVVQGGHGLVTLPFRPKSNFVNSPNNRPGKATTGEGSYFKV
jgi:hypothetical protein